MFELTDVMAKSSITGQDYFDLEKTVMQQNFQVQQQYGRTPKTVLGKDDFLKLLVTQLENQDPTKPMEDREFIAQMAQFSSLEQMMNMGKDMARINSMMAKGQAYALIGKTVTVNLGDNLVTGKVEEVSGNEYPVIKINGQYFDYTSVSAVRDEK